MADTQNEQFKELVFKLQLSPTGALSLNGLPMVLMPRHFFRYILREIHKAVGQEEFRRIYWQAGYDGAVTFCEAFQKSHACTSLEAVRGYLDEMSIRGWGHFSIRSIDASRGTMEVVLKNSALQSEGDIPSGNLVWEGAMAGSMAFLQKKMSGPFLAGTRAEGRETPAETAGETDFYISVMPAIAAKG
jgi:hypothetical protein